MESGRIVEQGTHSELLGAQGAYHRLYHAQFSQPVADVEEPVAPVPGAVPAGAPRQRG